MKDEYAEVRLPGIEGPFLAYFVTGTQNPQVQVFRNATGSRVFSVLAKIPAKLDVGDPVLLRGLPDE